MKKKPSSTLSEQSLKKATEADQKPKRPYPTKEEYLAGIKKIEKVYIAGYKRIL